jgi:DNA polymerase epsilon subunit 2
LFGGIQSNLENAQLLEIEKKAEDVSFVVLSDVWLDQPQVFEKLRILFRGYSDAIIPTLFVFIGNFQSTPFVCSSLDTKSYKDAMDQLANLISEFPKIASNSHFVFVPGCNDPWNGSVLPRPPLPSLFTRRLTSKVRNVHFACNPCRIKYCTQEIVIFREDLMQIAHRNQILSVAEDQQLSLERHVIVPYVVDLNCN